MFLEGYHFSDPLRFLQPRNVFFVINPLQVELEFWNLVCRFSRGPRCGIWLCRVFSSISPHHSLKFWSIFLIFWVLSSHGSPSNWSMKFMLSISHSTELYDQFQIQLRDSHKNGMSSYYMHTKFPLPGYTWRGDMQVANLKQKKNWPKNKIFQVVGDRRKGVWYWYWRTEPPKRYICSLYHIYILNSIPLP